MTEAAAIEVVPFKETDESVIGSTTPTVAASDNRAESSSFSVQYSAFIVKYKYTIVCVSWIFILIGLYFGKDAFSALRNGGFQPPHAESTLATQYLSRKLIFPERPIMIYIDGTNAGLRVNNPDFKGYYETIRKNIAAKAPVVGIVSYFDHPERVEMISDDGYKAFLYAIVAGDFTAVDVPSIVNVTPLLVKVGGAAVFGKEFSKKILEGVEYAEFGSLPILFALLMFSLGSFYAGLMSWYVALGGIFWTLALLVATNQSFRISSVSANITTLFGLGLAIDYSLFVVDRFKEERTKYPNAPLTVIVERTLKTSGRTIIFSAVTVFLALSGGLLFEEFFLTSLCYAVMIAAMCSAFGSSTYLMAQLAILDHSINKCPISLACCFGYKQSSSANIVIPVAYSTVATTTPADDEKTLEERAAANADNVESQLNDKNKQTFVDDDSEQKADHHNSKEQQDSTIATKPNAPTIRNFDEVDHETDPNIWLVIGRFSLRYPILILLACTAVLCAFTAVFFTQIKYGLVDADVLPITVEARVVYDKIRSNSFKEFKLLGQSNIYVYLQTDSSRSVRDSSFLDQLSGFQNDVQKNVKGVTNVISMVNLNFNGYDLQSYKNMYSAAFSPMYANTSKSLIYPLGITNMRDATYVSISLDYYQYSEEAKDAAKAVKNILPNYFKDPQGKSMLSFGGVTGAPADVLDLYASLDANLYVWISVMMVSIMVLIFFMTKSIVLPVKAVILSLLSLGATFGIIVLLFTTTDASTHKALNFVPTGYIDGSNLVFIFSVAFALSVDYELFLISAIQEEYHKCGDFRRSILISMMKTGRLITSAAVMLAVTTFAFIVNEIYFMKVIGVGTAIAVVLDATVVRLLMVPSFLILMGDYNWYCPEPLGALVDFVGFQEIGLEPLKEDPPKELPSAA